MNCKKTLFKLVLALAIQGSNPLEGLSAESKTGEPAQPKSSGGELGLKEPDRVLRRNDLVRITFRMPGRSLGSLEPVQKGGDVATPDGSFVKAEGLSLFAFRTNLAATYAGIIGYEGLEIEASIYSSPYRVVKYIQNPPSKPAEASTVANLPPATIFRRIFRAPLTLGDALALEGGVPEGVDPARIRVLKYDLKRQVLNCGGKGGGPDGGRFVESGDYIFLVPENTPLSSIFED